MGPSQTQTIKQRNPMTRTIADHNTRLLNLFAIAHGGIFALPVLLPYYASQIGLGFKELMIGEAVFGIMIILCEVPTGWLADHWKRKYCLALAGMVWLIGFTLLALADSFLQTVIAQGSLGIGASLVSGTQAALHYDSLLGELREEEYRRQEGRRMGFGLLSVGLSSTLGGFMYKIHPELPVAATMLSGLCMMITAILMIEPARHQVVRHRNPFAAMMETLRYALHGHKEIAELIFISAALFSTTKMMMWAQQPYYTSIQLGEQWFGLLMACGFVLGSLASSLGHVLDNRFRNRSVLLCMLVAVVVLCSASAALHNVAGALLLICGSAFWGMGWPRVQDAINKRADSHHRATVLSTASLMIHLFFIPLSLMLGWIGDSRGIQAAIQCLAALPVIGTVLTLRMVLRDRKERQIA